MGRPRYVKQDVRLNGPIGARTFWRVNGGYANDEFNTSRFNAGAQLTLRPSDRLSVSAEPLWQHGTEPRQ